MSRPLCFLVFFFLLLVIGCNERGVVPNSKTEQHLIIKELETQSGFVLPDDVELLEYMDDRGRDGSDGYYTWGFFSPSAITKMPRIKIPYITKGYLEVPLDTSVEYVQVMTDRRKIKQPQSTFCSYWESNGYEFRGTVVRTPEGDYMRVERFRSNESAKSRQAENPASSQEIIDNKINK